MEVILWLCCCKRKYFLHGKGPGCCILINKMFVFRQTKIFTCLQYLLLYILYWSNHMCFYVCKYQFAISWEPSESCGYSILSWKFRCRLDFRIFALLIICVFGVTARRSQGAQSSTLTWSTSWRKLWSCCRTPAGENQHDPWVLQQLGCFNNCVNMNQNFAFSVFYFAHH